MGASEVSESRAPDAARVCTASRRFACDPCGGRGWRPTSKRDAFPDVCALCRGRGFFSVYRMTRVLGVHPRTLERVELGRARAPSCERVLVKTLEMLNPPPHVACQIVTIVKELADACPHRTSSSSPRASNVARAVAATFGRSPRTPSASRSASSSSFARWRSSRTTTSARSRAATARPFRARAHGAASAS
jgi:hypothetical protein